MSLKSEAFMKTVGVFLVSAVIGSAMWLILEFVPVNVLLPILAVSVLVYLFVILYKFNLDQLKSQARLKELMENKG